MTIETEYMGVWKDTEFKEWDEVTEAGWKFEYLSNTGTVVMTNKGYINQFRNKV